MKDSNKHPKDCIHCRWALKKYVKDFMATNPTEEEIEEFYVNKILPIDKRSIKEILDVAYERGW